MSFTSCSSCARTTASIRCSIRSRWSTPSTRWSRTRRARSPPSRAGASSATPRVAARLQREQRLHAITTVLRYERHSYLLNFVPFGAGQFQNDQRRKGWFFFGVEAGLAAISIGALATNFALYGANPYRKCLQNPPSPGGCPPGDIDHTQEDHSRALLGVQLVSGGLFFATAIWGVIDAVRHYQRDVLLPEPSPSASPSGVRVGLTPLGLSVSF